MSKLSTLARSTRCARITTVAIATVLSIAACQTPTYKPIPGKDDETRGTDGTGGAALVGGGTIQFELPARLDQPDGPGNRVALSAGAWGAVGRIGTDARIAVVGEKTRLFVGAQLAAEGYTASAKVGGEYGGDIGFNDFFVSGRAVVSVEHAGD